MELRNGKILIEGVEVNNHELIFCHLKDLAEKGDFKLMEVEPIFLN